MINFDSLSLKAIVSEIEPILTEGRVRKVQQPSKNEVFLTIRALSENHKLYICVDPKYPHVALLSKTGEELRSIEIPKKPPMFCMLLRKHMEGAKINSVIQPGFERILEIEFDSYNELGERTPMVLACEFMGKYSNIILYSSESKIIQGCAHFVSHEKSRERELAGGLPYIYPPKQDKYDLSQLSKEKFTELSKNIGMLINIWLNEKFGFMSKALADELCNFLEISGTTTLSEEKSSALYDLIINTINFDNINPSVTEDKKYFSVISLDNSIKRQYFDSVNSMTDLYFGYQIFNDKLLRLKSYLAGILKKELKKQNLLLEHHLKTFDSENKQEKYRKYGDILTANLYKIRRGAEITEFEDFYDENKIIKIPLDKMLSPNENAQKYYKLYNKAKNAARHGKELAEKIQLEVNYLEGVKESLNRAETLSDLRETEQELTAQELIKSGSFQTSKKDKQDKINLSEFKSSDGISIFVGKNNKQNECILKIASPEDIWLHTQNIPGSHVLIKLPPENIEVPENTLHEAVYLAAYYSRAKESSNVPVVYTRKKYVKKPTGSKPGFVIYTHEKMLAVNPDIAKIDALKKV